MTTFTNPYIFYDAVVQGVNLDGQSIPLLDSGSHSTSIPLAFITRGDMNIDFENQVKGLVGLSWFVEYYFSFRTPRYNRIQLLAHINKVFEAIIEAGLPPGTAANNLLFQQCRVSLDFKNDPFLLGVINFSLQN